MKLTDGFILQTINNVPYLLPFGQRIAEQRHGMKINHSSAFLWNAIPKVQNKEELLTLFAEHFHATPEEVPKLKKDMDTFLHQLSVWGMIDENDKTDDVLKTSYIHIGGLYLEFNTPDNALSEEFSPFSITECPSIDMRIDITTTNGLSAATAGKLLLRAEDLIVCEQDNDYLIYFPMAEQIKEAILKKDGSYAHFFCLPPYREPLKADLFHAIRLVFLYLAQKKGRLAIHSASLYYKKKAWLFSGSSGTGKSTHTNLWHDLFQTPVINGDLNLIELTEKGPVIHGMPWCGTSQIADPETYPLGGIILLKKAEKNLFQKLSIDEKTLFILQRSISPSWTKDMLNENISFVGELASEIYVTRLLCTKEPAAAYFMKTQIDEYERTKNGGKYDT